MEDKSVDCKECTFCYPYVIYCEKQDEAIKGNRIKNSKCSLFIPKEEKEEVVRDATWKDLKKENDKLKKEVNVLQEQNLVLQKENDELEKEKKTLKNTVSYREYEIKELNTTICDKDENFKKSIYSLEGKIDLLRHENQNSREDLEKKQVIFIENKKLKTDLKACEYHSEQIEGVCRELTVKVKSTTRMFNSLKEEFKTVKKENCEFKRRLDVYDSVWSRFMEEK